MIKIKHIALWANDIEEIKAFYQNYFGANANSKYINKKTGFQSYFLSFSSGVQLEVMQRPDIKTGNKEGFNQELFGYAHLAFSVGTEISVDELTKKLAADGFVHIDGPRRTGDGYYESVVLDPEGNRIEITI